jgi:hypothetical protein
MQHDTPQLETVPIPALTGTCDIPWAEKAIDISHFRFNYSKCMTSICTQDSWKRIADRGPSLMEVAVNLSPVRSRARRLAIASAASALVLPFAFAPANAANHTNATVSVLHGIPAGAGADVVDVYAGNDLIIDNFTPGSLETLTVPAGTYDLAVFADGEAPGSGTAVLSASGVQVPAGANATVAAHLDADGNPKLTVFVNDTSQLAAGDARIIVRHLAAAPAVDVRANGDVVFANLTNPNEDAADIGAGTIEADVVLAGTTTVAIGPATLNLAEGTATIVYAWGSAEGGSLDLAVQTIDGLAGAPDGVDAGDGSASGQATLLWMIAAIAAAGVAFSGARLARNRA